MADDLPQDAAGAGGRPLAKRLWTLPAVHVLLGLLVRWWRWFAPGTALIDHDERLMRLLRGDEPVIWAVWHQDFPTTLGFISRWNARRRTWPLASASRDGTLAAVVAEALGYRSPIRGSSTRGGRKALLALTRLVKADPTASVAVVVDGPRPPARVLKPGVLHLAQASGRPIWLVRSSFKPMAVFERSWARFHFPIPGCRGVLLADGPIHVPPNLGREAFEAMRLDVERRLNDLADRADAAVGHTTSR